MMRSRAVREGAVGLLILGGLLSFAGIFVWIYNLRPNAQSYRFNLRSPNVAGLTAGAAVRLRGVTIGRVESVDPQPEAVQIGVQIEGSTRIPRDSDFRTVPTGLVGETVLNILPRPDVAPLADDAPLPTDSDCDRSLIVCQGDTIQANPGVDYAQLVTSLTGLAQRINNDEFIGNLNETFVGVAAASQNIAKLSATLEQKVAAVDIQDLDLSRFTAAANSISKAADAIQVTAGSFRGSADQLNGILAENRTNLSASLQNIQQATTDLRAISTSLQPVLTDPEIKANLQAILANAANASKSAAAAADNLQQISANLNDPGTLATLRQTLDSARVTFQNAQKISADLDELTGDPKFRQDLRNLVQSLRRLVSAAPTSLAPAAPTSAPFSYTLASQERIPAQPAP